jgi:ubiquitin-protein ligase
VKDALASREVQSCSTGARTKRILKELRNLKARERVSVFPQLSNAGSVDGMTVLLEGLDKSPYAGCCFELSVRFPSDYPFRSPNVRFVTPIYHYAVNTNGGMCLDILKTCWSPATTIDKVFEEIDGLIMAPEQKDPGCCNSLRSYLSDLKRTQPDVYFANAAQHARQHAGSSAADKSAEILKRG